MRHLGLLNRFLLACVFALTSTAWAAPAAPNTNWRDKDDVLSKAYGTDPNIDHFIDEVHRQFLLDVNDKSIKPEDRPKASEWKDSILPSLKTEVTKLQGLVSDQPKLLAEIDRSVKEGTFHLENFKTVVTTDDTAEASGDDCDGHCGPTADANPETQPIAKPVVQQVKKTEQAARQAAGDPPDQGDQGAPPPLQPRAAPVIIPTGPVAPDAVTAGVSVSTNSNGLASLFGGGGMGGALMPMIFGAMMSNMFSNQFQQRNQFGLFGGGYPGMYQFGAASMYPGMYGGYNRFGMFGPGGMYGQGGSYSALGLPSVYRAPGVMGAGYSNYGGIGGAPAILPYATTSSIYGNNYSLPSIYRAGSTPAGVH